MTAKVRSPFENGPRTVIRRDEEGQENYHVYPAAIGPRMAKLADILSLGVAVLSGAGALAGVAFIPDAPVWAYAPPLAVPFAAYPLIRRGLHRLFSRSVHVVYTPDRFIIHGWFRKKVFDRNMPHKFTLYAHRHAEREADMIAFRKQHGAKRWWQRPPQSYFGKSQHLAFEYMGQRNDIILIYGPHEAHDILTGMIARDDLMDGKAGNGRGQVLTPEEDWIETAGELPGAV